MSINLIGNEIEYNSTLDRVDKLMKLNPKMHTDLSDELEALALLLEKYEEKTWVISEPDTIKTIKICMEEIQLRAKL